MVNHYKFTKSVFVFLIGLLVSFNSGISLAQDTESLKNAVIEFYDRLNNENPSYAEYFHSASNSFPRTGLLLAPSPDVASARANIDTGLDFEVILHHLDAQVYGSSGVATYYTTGTTTYPDGTILTGTYRASIVAIRQGSQWRWVHLHISQLDTELN